MDSYAENPVKMLLVGVEGGELRLAAGMARENGAQVDIATGLPDALARLRTGQSNAAMVDVRLDVPGFIEQLRADKIAVPVIACGIDAPAPAAVAAIRAGACDYVPLPPELELIAAAIELAASRLSRAIEVGALVGHTVADVERELILNTLDRCHGNRTSASTILGISVRTMRNKLRTFIEAGIPVSPPSL